MIPAEAIAEVKARVDLVAFIEGQGIPLKRRGKGFLGLCPLHRDTRPSLSVDPVKQYWCCLGACSAGGRIVGGDVIELARRLWDVGLREALERLGGKTSIALQAPAPRSSPARPVRPPRRAPPSLLAQVVALYHQSFLGSREAREYAASRGLTNAGILAALPMGYADGTLLERVAEGSQTYEQLLTHGIVTAGGSGQSPRELMAGCLVVPMRDLEGVVVNLYGRAIEPGRSARHLYLPGPRRGLVNAECAASAEELILTESIFDALSFLEAGIPNAVPLYGVNGFTEDHEALLERYRIRRVVLALDTDEAGRAAARAIAQKLRGRGIEVLDVVLS